MINTRIYDRAPLKDVRVKEPQVGRVRTPQILMSRTNEGYQKGDILDANTTAILIKNLHSPDIERLQEQIEEARRKLADAVMKDSVGAPGGVASLDGNGNIPTSQLGNVDVDIFMIVNELPTENIKNNKIYCIKDTESTDENNTYIEYAYIDNAWEKVGEFKADPDLSQYAKLDKNNTFTKKCSFMGAGGIDIGLSAKGTTDLEYLTIRGGIKNWYPKPNMAYVTTGSTFDLNTKLDVDTYNTDKEQLSADLSGYAKLNGATFTNNVNLNGSFNSTNGFSIRYLNKSSVGYLKAGGTSNDVINEHQVYNTNGGLSDIGTSEDFIFTLENGTKVTKSIRVVSTTTSQADA